MPMVERWARGRAAEGAGGGVQDLYKLLRGHPVAGGVAGGNGDLSWGRGKCFRTLTRGRSWSRGKVHGRRSEHKGLSWVQLWCLISVHPAVEGSSLVFIKPSAKAKGQEFCAIGSVRIEVSPVSVRPACAAHRAVLLLVPRPRPCLGYSISGLGRPSALSN